MEIAIRIEKCNFKATINVSECKIYKDIKDIGVQTSVSHIGVQADDVQATTGAKPRVYPSAENRSQIYEDLEDNAIKTSQTKSQQKSKSIKPLRTQPNKNNEKENIKAAPTQKLESLLNERNRQYIKRCESGIELCKKLQERLDVLTKPVEKTVISSEEVSQRKKSVSSVRQTQEATWDEEQTVPKTLKHCLRSSTKHQNVVDNTKKLLHSDKPKSSITIKSQQEDAPRLKNETRHLSLQDIPALARQILDARRKQRQDTKSRHSVDHKCHRVDKATQTYRPLAREPSFKVTMMLHRELTPKITMLFDDFRKGRKTAKDIEKKRNRLRSRLFSQMIAQGARIGCVNYSLSTLLL